MSNNYVDLPLEGGGGGVTSLNTLTGDLTLAAGSGITITPSGGDTLTIASTDAGGTVTSVALTAPSIINVAGSPITTSGTLALTLANQTANTVFAGPSTGSPAAPTFRALVTADLPSGTGDVVGPGSAVDSQVALFNGTTGKLIKASTASGVAHLSTGVLTGSAVVLTSEVSGILPIANGGTNSSTALNNNRIMQSSSGSIVEATAITASRALVSDSNGIPVAATTTTTEINFVNGVTSAIQTQLNNKQPLDATLTALAAYNTNGLLTQTAADTFTGRTITGTANQITATNGDGVSGNPTLSIPSAFTLPGNMQMLANGSIQLVAALSDAQYSGITVAGTAGTTLAFGDLVYMAAADSRWELTDADAEATAGPVRVAMCVLAAAADGDPTVLLLYGKIRADSNFPTLTIGAPAYISTTTGDIQVAQPNGTDDVIRIIGYGVTADELFFNPSNNYITHT